MPSFANSLCKAWSKGDLLKWWGKIQNYEVKSWRYIPTAQNPADLGSCGGPVSNNDLWWKGPAWLPHPEQWPQNSMTSTSEESEAEAKTVKEVMAITINETDEFDELLGIYNFRTTL